MTIPQCTITINDLSALIGATVTALSDVEVVFTPNLTNGDVLAINDSIYRVADVRGVINADGELEDLDGNTGVTLLANDPLLNLDWWLQWKVSFSNVVVNGFRKTIKPWWFTAPNDGETVDLRLLPHVVGTTATGTTTAIIQGVPVTVDNISDSGAVGRSLVQAEDVADAWDALGGTAAVDLPFFDVRDYGVVADGEPHNNVANLLDCMAAIKAAGGGEMLLPAGIIDTSDAVIGLVTADSGNVYDNKGGIPLPTSFQYAGTNGDTPLPVPCPVTITGQGRGVTVLRLSAGFTRGFDFWMAYYYGSASGQGFGPSTWDRVTIRGITFDRDNLTATDLGPLTEMPIATTTGFDGTGLWVAANTPLPIPDPQNFKNCKVLWFPGLGVRVVSTYTAPADLSGETLAAYPNGYVSMNVGRYFYPGTTVQGGLYDHVIVGTDYYARMNANGYNCTVKNLLVEDCEAINVTTIVPSSYGGGGNIAAFAAAISLYPVPIDNSALSLPLNLPEGYVCTVENIKIRNVDVYGGATGFQIMGAENVWIDEITLENCSHDTGVIATEFYWSSNFIIGGYAWVGTVRLSNCVGKRSGDVGIEIDQPTIAYIKSCRIEDPRSCSIYPHMFSMPARSSAGPPTAALAADINDSVTAVDIDALPAGAPQSGCAKIGTELVWYEVDDATGTSITVSRGFNGSTPAAHSEDDTVTFFSHHGRIYVDDCEFFAEEGLLLASGTSLGVRVDGGGGSYPYPAITMRGNTATFVGSGIGGEATSAVGQFFTSGAWIPDLEISGTRMVYEGCIPSVDSSLVLIDWQEGADTASTPMPAPTIVGRDNHFQWTGLTDDDYNFSTVYLKSGYARLDLDVSCETVMNGISSSSASTGINMVMVGGGTSTVLAPGSRVGITGITPAGVPNDPAPSCLSVRSTSTATIQDTLTVDVDATDLSFTATSGDTNYRPWTVDTTQVDKVKVRNAKHSSAVTSDYGSTYHPTKVVTSDYDVAPSDEILLVNTTSQEITVTLPAAIAGHSALGVPLVQGRTVTVMDAGLNAAVNNIIIAAADGETIDGAASKTLSTTGEAATVCHYGGVGWVSMGSSTAVEAAAVSEALTGDGEVSLDGGVAASAGTDVIDCGDATNI